MRYVFLAFILLVVAAAGTYAYLGGTQAPTVQLQTTAAPVLLAGQPYVGSLQGDAFGQLFRQAKDAQDQGRITGDLANLYLSNTERAEDTVRAFVGLAVADTARPLPAGFRYRVVPAGQRVMAARISGVSFMLAPNKLYPAAIAAIKVQKLTQRGNFYLERFGADETAEVWIGVK